MGPLVTVHSVCGGRNPEPVYLDPIVRDVWDFAEDAGGRKIG